MSVGILFVMVQTFLHIRYKFRNMNDLRFTEPRYFNLMKWKDNRKMKNFRSSNIQELRHEISVWQRAAASLSSYSKDEDLVRETLLKKVNRLSRQLKKRLASGSVPVESYKATLEELQAKVCYLTDAYHLLQNPTFVFRFSIPSATKIYSSSLPSHWHLR